MSSYHQLQNFETNNYRERARPLRPSSPTIFMKTIKNGAENIDPNGGSFF